MVRPNASAQWDVMASIVGEDIERERPVATFMAGRDGDGEHSNLGRGRTRCLIGSGGIPGTRTEEAGRDRETPLAVPHERTSRHCANIAFDPAHAKPVGTDHMCS